MRVVRVVWLVTVVGLVVATKAEAYWVIYEVVEETARVCLRKVEVHDAGNPVWWAEVNTLGCWPMSQVRLVRRCAAVKRVAKTEVGEVAAALACAEMVPELPEKARHEGIIKPYVYGKSSTEQLRGQAKRPRERSR